MMLFSSDKKIVDQAHEWFKKAQQKHAKWRTNAREDYGFYIGDGQWSQEDRAYLEENGRPIVTFNRCAPTIDAVTGSERNNRQEVRFLPRTMEDGQTNEMLTSVARWIRDECNAEYEESEAFADALICGMGWTETWIDFEEDPEGRIRIDRISPLEMYWDWQSGKRNLADSRWVMWVRLLAKSEVKQRWPNKRINYSDGFSVREIDAPHDADRAQFYEQDQGYRSDTKTIPVAQLQWWERRPFYRVATDDGFEFLSDKEYGLVKEEIESRGFPVLRQTRKEYFKAFVCGKTLLEKQVLHEGSNVIPGFTLKCITGKRNEEDRSWSGLMEAMKDPQRWSNKFFSQIQDIVNSNAKGGLLAEQDAFVNPRKAEEDWSKPDRIIWTTPGAISTGKIQERVSSNYPTGLDRLMQVAMGATRDVTGINVEFLGLAERSQAGVVEASRVKQGLTILATFFDSLRYYRKLQGSVLLHFIREYIPDQRLIRVVGEDRYIPYKKDAAYEQYDVIVDQAPTSPNMKEEAWAGFQQVLPALVKSGLPIPPDVIDFLPLPTSVLIKIKKFYQEQSKPDPKAQQAREFELQKLKAEVQETIASAIKKLADAQGVQEARQNDRDANQIEAFKLFAENLVEEPNGRVGSGV